jgi:hypothetical protein
MSILSISTYVKAHEKLILALIAAGVLWFSLGKIESVIARHDEATLKTTTLLAANDATKNAALAAQAATDKAAYQALAAKVDAENAALVNANASLAAALTRQQKVDATLPPTELVARWNTLVPAANVAVTPEGVTLPALGATATVQQLEQVPVLQTELSNSNTEKQNVDALLLSSNGEVSILNTQVGQLQQTIIDNKTQCTDQLKVQADKARKRERWYAVIGAILGFAVRR